VRSTSLTRHLPLAVGVAAVGLFVASPALAGADHGRGEGPLTSYNAAIPRGAAAKVTAVYDAAGKSTVLLHVKGMTPNTEYGAHAHVSPCGLTAAAAGPHFQNVVDPAATSTKPSVNPFYANPQNEIWLDLTTNAAGNGLARTVVPWQFNADRRPQSVIIHTQHTSTEPGTSGTAGARLACINVGF
jgi:Cu-Zn family superoxide dismutase